MDQEMARLADFLGRDDPEVIRLLRTAQNRDYQDLVRRALRRRCKAVAGVDADNLPAFPLVRQLPPGDVLIGCALNGEREGPVVTIPAEQICRHTGIFGQSGCGKTSLSKAIAQQWMALGDEFKVWIIDTQDEYADLVPEYPASKLVPITPDMLRISLCQPADSSLSPQSELLRLSLLLRGTQYLRDGSANLFVDKLMRRLDENGVFAGIPRYPTLPEMLDLFKGSRFGMKSRNAGYLETIINRLTMLQDSLPDTFNASHSEMLAFLAGRSVIFRLHSTVGITLQFLISFLLGWLLVYRSAQRDGSTHLVVIEEPHLLSADPRRQDIGEHVLPTAFRLARHSGVGLLLCDQVPSLLPPAIVSNMATCIVMRMSGGRDIWSVSNSMSLTPQQSAELTELGPRTAAVQYAGYPLAFLARVPEVGFPERPSESGLRRRCEKALEPVRFSVPSGSSASANGASSQGQAASPEGLGGDALKVMLSICAHSDFTIERRCEELKMDRSREFRARTVLLDRGLIEEASTGMGKARFYVASQEGEHEWARSRRVKVRRWKSGPAHEAILRSVEKAFGTACPKCRFRRGTTLTAEYDKQPDLTAIVDEWLLVIEVCCSNPAYEATSLVDEAEIPEIDRLIAVTPSVDMRRKLGQAVVEVATRRGRPGLSGKVTVLNASQCIRPDFDWQSVLEKCP